MLAKILFYEPDSWSPLLSEDSLHKGEQVFSEIMQVSQTTFVIVRESKLFPNGIYVSTLHRWLLN
jgi:hypothetical protein